MSASQGLTDLEFSQSQTMASGRRSMKRKRYSGSFAGSSGRGYSKAYSRVPRAIATRGTPDGYTEINYTQMIRLYTQTSTGFWATAQDTVAPYGIQGFSGLGFSFTPSNTRITFGNAGASTSYMDVAISDMANLSTIFDEVKLAKVKVEVWINAQSSNINNNLSNTPEIWMAVDPNDSFPATTSIQEYSHSRRILPDRNTIMSFKPHLVADNAANDAGNGATSGATMQQGYVRSNSTAYHYGLKALYWVPYEPDTAQVFFTQFRITFTRRFKSHK